MEFKGTKVFPKYEGGDNTSIDMIFESGAVISIDRRDRYSDKLVMSREEMEANAKLISKAPDLLEMLNNFVEISDELNAPDHLIETFANLYANAFNTIQEATTI